MSAALVVLTGAAGLLALCLVFAFALGHLHLYFLRKQRTESAFAQLAREYDRYCQSKEALESLLRKSGVGASCAAREGGAA